MKAELVVVTWVAGRADKKVGTKAGPLAVCVSVYVCVYVCVCIIFGLFLLLTAYACILK